MAAMARPPATSVAGAGERRPGGPSPGRGRGPRDGSCARPNLGEAVPETVDGLDVARAGRVGLDLAAQVLDVGVDGALVGLERDPVEGVEQLSAGEDAARLAG